MLRSHRFFARREQATGEGGEGQGAGGSPATTPAAGAATGAPAAPAADPLADKVRILEGERAQLTAQVQARDLQITELGAKVQTLAGQVGTYERGAKEGAVVEAIRGKLPHATPLEIKAGLAVLHEQGRVDRYSAEPAKAADAALEIMQREMPALFRPPAQGGGPGGAPVNPNPTTRKGPCSG